MSNNWRKQHGELPDGWQPNRTELELARFTIVCDEPGCTECAPPSDAVNFETGGEKQARALAEQNGWVRVRVGGESKDLCPAHKPSTERPLRVRVP